MRSLKGALRGTWLLVGVIVLAAILVALAGCNRSDAVSQQANLPGQRGGDGGGSAQGGEQGPGHGAVPAPSRQPAGGSAGEARSPGGRQGPGQGGPQMPELQDYRLAVYLDGVKLKEFTVDDVAALPQSKVEANGRTFEGPALKEVLGAAGITKFSKVTVTGARGMTCTLEKAEVDRGLLLDVGSRRVCTLVGREFSPDNWVPAVTKIEASK